MQSAQWILKFITLFQVHKGLIVIWEVKNYFTLLNLCQRKIMIIAVFKGARYMIICPIEDVHWSHWKNIKWWSTQPSVTKTHPSLQRGRRMWKVRLDEKWRKRFLYLSSVLRMEVCVHSYASYRELYEKQPIFKLIRPWLRKSNMFSLIRGSDVLYGST